METLLGMAVLGVCFVAAYAEDPKDAVGSLISMLIVVVVAAAGLQMHYGWHWF